MTTDTSTVQFWNLTLIRLKRLLKMAKVYEFQRGRMNDDRLDSFVVCQGRHIEFPKFDERDVTICKLQVEILETFNKTLPYSFLLDYIREGAIQSWLNFLDRLIQLEEPEEGDHTGMKRRTYALKVHVNFALHYEVITYRPASKLYGRRMLVRDVFQHRFVKTVVNYGLNGVRIPPKALKLIFIYCQCYIQGMSSEFPDLIDNMSELVKRHFSVTVGETRKSIKDRYWPVMGVRDSNAWHDCEPLDTIMNLPDSPFWALTNLMGSLRSSLDLFDITLEIFDRCSEDEPKVCDALVEITLICFITYSKPNSCQINKILETIWGCLISQNTESKEIACWSLASILVFLKYVGANINEVPILDAFKSELVKCCLNPSSVPSPALKDAAIALVNLSKLDENRFKLDDKTVDKILPRLISIHHKVTKVFMIFMSRYPERVRNLSGSIFEALFSSYKSSYKVTTDGWELRSLLLGLLLRLVNNQDIFGQRSESDESAVLDIWIDFNQDSRNDAAGFLCEDKRWLWGQPKIHQQTEMLIFLRNRENPEDVYRVFSSIAAAVTRGRDLETTMYPIQSYLYDSDLGDPVSLRLMCIILDNEPCRYLLFVLLERILSRLCEEEDNPVLLEVLDRIKQSDPERFERQREKLIEDRRVLLLNKLYPNK